MDDKTKRQTPGSQEPESRSAFPRRSASTPPAEQRDADEKPIPSQPRSFSPVRPQRQNPARKSLTTPPPAAGGAPLDEKPASAPAKPEPGPEKQADGPEAEAIAPADSAPAQPADSAPPAQDSGEEKSAPAAADAAPAAAKDAVPERAAVAGRPRTGAMAAPSAGGDTIRLRVSPRPQARTLNTAPGRGVRRRLPDVRQGRTTASSSGHYGPFALFFGFLWLIFKMVFFTVLVLGLGALIGFMVMTEYIKTPEVTVPNVTGMKVDEAFGQLSDKKLGIIKRGTESSGLVAQDEIISQQPPAGAKAKVNTDVGVIISSGRAQYVVPSVINETKENAINKIRGARLEVGNVLTVEDASIARGNVISQSPIGGTGEDSPVKVDLMISAGPPGKSLTMPDLSGRTVLEATAALKAVGVDDVVTEPADASQTAKVTGHDPLVGKTVFQTDRVTLFTGKR